MKPRFARICVPVILAAVSAPLGWAQRAARGNFQVESTLVLVNVTVTDARGQFVTSLGRQDFQVFEDKMPQTVAYFSSEEAPVSVGLVLDFSRSMAPRFGQLKEAVTEFLKSANPEDEFCLIEFRDHAQLSAGFTSEPGTIQNRVAWASPEGSTALLDAVFLGLHQMRKARNPRKILLIVSDGGDNHSRYGVREVEDLARESDVEIYAIGIGARMRAAYDMWDGPALLSDLTEEAGGRWYEIGNARELPAAAERIGRELRHEYVLGYVPSNRHRDGRYRHIQVKVPRAPGQPRLSAYWKHGYYAPRAEGGFQR